MTLPSDTYFNFRFNKKTFMCFHFWCLLRWNTFEWEKRNWKWLVRSLKPCSTSTLDFTKNSLHSTSFLNFLLFLLKILITYLFVLFGDDNENVDPSKEWTSRQETLSSRQSFRRHSLPPKVLMILLCCIAGIRHVTLYDLCYCVIRVYIIMHYAYA